MEFVYAVVWKRTVSYCFTICTCDLQHQKFIWFISFNTLSCYKCFGHCFIVLSLCAEVYFVEESKDSLAVFNLGFCLVTFDFWFVESLEEDGDFCIFVRKCLVLSMSFWLYLDLFCFNFWQENFLQSGNMGIVLLWICVSFSYLCELGPNTTSCKVCNKFKLHFSSPTKRDSHEF